MKNLVLKTAAILLFASVSSLIGQNQVKFIQQPKSVREITKKTYAFRTFKEKEMVVKIAYRKLTYNLRDMSYPKDILSQEKRELICLITAQVLNEKTS